MKFKVEKSLNRLLRRQFLLPAAAIYADKRIRDWHMNAFEMNELLATVEHMYHIELEDQQVAQVKTYDDLVSLVTNTVKTAA